MKSKKNKVCILLSAYNGEKYIQDQIESIEKQEEIEIILLIRDDGSSDKTIDKIEEEKRRYRNITLLRGKNMGVIASFNMLVQEALKIDADYFAFSDQDDIWLNTKIIDGIKRIEQYPFNKPNLYFSNLLAVDEQLNPQFEVYKSFLKINKKAAMIRNYAYGCTTIFNRQLLVLYNESIHSRMWMHDYWAYLIALFMGNVVYDAQPRILYRQHKDNVHGAQHGIRLNRFKINHIVKVLTNHPRENMITDYLYHFKDRIREEDIEIIEDFILYPKTIQGRLKAAFDKDYKVYDGHQNLFLMLKFIFGVV